MTVADMIKKLQALGRPELPVCLADWNECYMEPWEEAAEQIAVVDENYRNWPDGEMVRGEFVKIGAIGRCAD